MAQPSTLPEFHTLPSSVAFTLEDGTRLTAAVRLSARARRTRLSLDQRDTLMLTVPASLLPEQLHDSLSFFQPWLERVWKKRRQQTKGQVLPRSVTLPLAGRTIVIESGGDMAAGRLASTRKDADTLLVNRGTRRVLVVETADLLHIFGSMEDKPLCAEALRQWCRKAATRLLPQYLGSLAHQGGFALAAVTVRDQSRRWGSCSRLRPVQLPFGGGQGRRQALTGQAPAGRININWRALLLPLPLLEHLCWHELCHLRHMNHSSTYRKELERYSPLWPQREKDLNAAWKELPWWALPE